MSSMLEQAIIDAAALREAALKNAEQSLIEKYAPQIKEAVNNMLENDGFVGKKVKYEGQVVQVTTEAENGMVGISLGGKTHLVNEAEIQNLSEDELLQEEDMDLGTDVGATSSANIEAPFAGNPSIQPDENVEFTLDVESFDDQIEINLDDLEKEMAGETIPEDDMVSIGDMADDEIAFDNLLTPDDETESMEEPQDEEGDLQLQELLNLLEEYETDILEEEAYADMGSNKQGWITTDVPHQEYEQNMQMAADNLNEEDGDDEEESIEKEEDKTPELYETIDLLKTQNKKLESIVYKLSDKLEETLLSNAKLLYQNRTLCDASLNERQKERIVEAIAKAESPKEAKHLHETLRSTMGAAKKVAPKSLNESVNNRPNLSGMLNRRQNLNESQNSDPLFKKMQKLAGIK